VTIGLFPLARNYTVAVALLVLAGMFNIAFTSMAQTLVQVLAPPRLRGRMVGLFNTAILGLRAGSGVTVGVLGAVVNVHWSLALSAAAVVVTAAGLLAWEGRSNHERRCPKTPERRGWKCHARPIDRSGQANASGGGSSKVGSA
jgi:MFS family permease